MKKTLVCLMALALVFTVGCTFIPQPLDGPGMVRETERPAEKLDFTSEDMEGNTVSFSDFSDGKVIMLNFFEAWCGPCVNEMPDLEALYEKYKDEGLVIIGAFGSSEYDEIETLIGSIGVTYPIVPVTESMRSFATQYVPTTVFFDAEGTLLTDEPYVGSQSYEGWESIIVSLLGK